MKLLTIVFTLFTFSAPTFAQHDVVYEDIIMNTSSTEITFGNDSVRLVFDIKNGGWQKLLYPNISENLISSPTFPDVKIDGAWIMPAGPKTLNNFFVSVDRFRKRVTLQLAWTIAEDYTLTAQYTLAPRHSTIERSASIVRNAKAKETSVKFEAFSFPINGLKIGDAATCTINIPGPFFPNTFVGSYTPYDSLKSKKIHFHSAPDAGFGLLMMQNKKQNKTIGVWMNTAGEVNYVPFINGDGKLLTMGHDNLRFYNLKKGMAVTSDIQIIAASNNAETILSAYRKVCEKTMPMDSLAADWVKGMVILEIFPNYFKGGFKEITAQLDKYKTVGFNTIYLMPHWKGGYSPIDPFAVEPEYGTEEDLKLLVSTAHKLGMKVLFDMVIHGFNNQSMVPKEKPDMFIHNTDGTLAMHPTWRSISTDWAEETYQQYMVDLVMHDLKKYDIDGYRIDAASYKGPNWDPSIPYPAYRSGAAAPELMKRMLAAMRSEKKDAIFLNEVFGPVFYHVSNLSHDNQTEAIQVLIERMNQGRYSAAQYKQYLHDVYAILPKGANRVFFTRNHDTSWFYHFNGYSPLYFCFEAIHSFFGIPEVFAGDPGYKFNPDDKPEIYNTYKRFFALRDKHPALTKGEVILKEVQSTNSNIFTGIRKFNNNVSLVVINMSAKESKTTLKLQSQNLTFPPHVQLQDAMADKTVDAKASTELTLTLKPYQILLGNWTTQN